MRKTMKKIQISSFFLDWQFIPMIKVYIMSIIFHDYKVCICKRIKNSRKITQIIKLEQKITLKFLIVKIKFGEKFLKFWSASGKSFGFLRKYLPLQLSSLASSVFTKINSRLLAKNNYTHV